MIDLGDVVKHGLEGEHDKAVLHRDHGLLCVFAQPDVDDDRAETARVDRPRWLHVAVPALPLAKQPVDPVG